MKTSVRWLNQYLQPGDLTAPQVEQLLTFAGFPVESSEALTDSRGPDTRLDVELTSNRGDCLSHLGLARELAAVSGREFLPPAIPDVKRAGNEVARQATLRNDDHEACPMFT